MKTVILAGGLGTRLSEETALRPKPMVEIGGRPILWHVMSAYSRYGFREFVIACGYKGEVIKEYFSDFFFHHSDFTVNLHDGERTVVAKRTAGLVRPPRGHHIEYVLPCDHRFLVHREKPFVSRPSNDCES